MLLRDDVPADRQAETSAFACRLGGEEGLEQFVAMFGPNAGAVVAHPDLDFAAEVAGRDLEHRAIGRIRPLAAPFGGGIKTVADQVEENPGDLLEYEVDGDDVGIEIALQGDVEARVLSASAVIRQAERLLD